MTLGNVGLALLLVVNAVAMAACFDMVYRGERQACAMRWADSGMASRWKDGVGCQVEHKRGLWINESFLKGRQP